MPGRVPARASRSSAAALSTKSSTQTLRTHGSTSTRASAAAVEIPDEGPTTALRTHICGIFTDAQRGTATQRKLAVTLRKVQEACCYEPVQPRKNNLHEEYGEEEFNLEVGRCVIRVLAVKKSESVGDKIVRFLGLFLKLASDKDNAIMLNADPDATTLPETPTSRLTSQIISTILPLLAAKDKVVRFRATQIIAHIINTLDSIDDELFQLIRLGLLKRLRDKEAAVRVQAVLGLGRLADEGDDGDENEDSDDESLGGVLEKLLDVLQNDPSAEVRRSLLLNLPFMPGTLPYLLERARDCDGATRRALYSRLLPALGDFRHLSLTHREKLLRWGMRDRDENVRKATARLFRERWIEDCAGLREATEEGAPAPPQVFEPSFDALLELLERVDVVNSGVEGGIALEAMQEFWDGRPDYRDYVRFEESFWNELSPESVFVARTFNSYCRQSEDSRLQNMAEDRMPEVTRFAFLLQKHIGTLVDGVRRVALLEAGEDDPDAEEDTVQQEFVVEQLLQIALTLDYSDEVGRRTTFSVMREGLALAELPEECTKLVIEVLRTVCGHTASGEREFCGIVLEAVAEVHDAIMGDDSTEPEENVYESFHSARSELSQETTPTRAKKPRKPKDDELDDAEREELEADKAVREIMVNMKCLHIAQCMLQNVQCDLEQNSHLVTMLNNLVVPAVRSQEAPIRERGLICLGLCCLLSDNLAQENLELFLHCFAKGHESLQTIVIQIISDMLTAHPSLLKPSSQPGEETEPSRFLKPVHKIYSKSLKSVSLEVQHTGAVALSKLMLTGTIADQDLLRLLVLAYFDPDTRANAGLRQALTYFLPVFCHSRAKNAIALSGVALSVLHTLASRAEELDEEEEMVGLNVVAAQIADWTDPRKLVGGIEMERFEERGAHCVLADELLEKVLTPGCGKEERKLYAATLPKLHLASSSGSPSALHALNDLATEALESRQLVADAPARNAVTKFQTALVKVLPDEEADVTIVDRTRLSTATGREGNEMDIEQTEAGAQEAAEEDDEMTQLDDTMTQLAITGMPDAEGTVFGDYDDEDEERNGDDSLVESLLDD